jgi:hypothetical protein
MENNYIAKEASKDEIDIVQEYEAKGKLHTDWFPLPTYDLVQMGYPRPDHGGMVSNVYGGTDGEGRLLPPDGMWCKVEDVKKYIDEIKNMIEK